MDILSVDHHLAIVKDLRKCDVALEDTAELTGGIERDVRLRDYRKTMKAKYERFARGPWLSAEPAPSIPERILRLGE